MSWDSKSIGALVKFLEEILLFFNGDVLGYTELKGRKESHNEVQVNKVTDPPR